MSSAATLTKEIHHTDYAELQLLRGAALESVEGILKNCSVRELRSGEILARPGKPDHCLYGIVHGRVSVRASQDGAPLGFIEAGDCVGESAVLDHRPYLHFIVAEAPTRLLVIDEERFLELINTSHEAACNFVLRLTARLRGGSAATESEAQLQQRYQRAAHTDTLTGLHNQRAFEEMLARQMMRSAMDKQALALAVLDIDKLSEVNRQFGNAVGDQAIYTVAQSLRQHCRPTDLIGRLGGDKFAVLLPSTDIDGAEIAAAHMRDIVARTAIVIPQECVLPPVTVSIGIAPMTAFVAAERLLADAVAALERAQTQGGNAVAR